MYIATEWTNKVWLSNLRKLRNPKASMLPLNQQSCLTNLSQQPTFFLQLDGCLMGATQWNSDWCTCLPALDQLVYLKTHVCSPGFVWRCVSVSPFRKRIQKDNITFHENFTVSYREYRSYYFEPSMSVGTESDVVTIPNMLVLVRWFKPDLTLNTYFCHVVHGCVHWYALSPNCVLQGAAVMMENLPYAVRLMISATFKTFKEGPFLTKTVGELMWGYDSGLVDFLNKYLPGMLPSSGKFGLFAEVGGLSIRYLFFMCLLP